eukprot:14379284-Ditylum_brightwellii.AAC.1
MTPKHPCYYILSKIGLFNLRCGKDNFELIALGLMVSYISDIELSSLDEHLEIGAELEGILFSCHQRNGTSFLPSQNYASWTRMTRSHIWSIAHGQAEGVNEYFPFMDSGNALEMVYSCLCTCCKGAEGSGSDMDIVQFGDQVGGVMEIENGVNISNTHHQGLESAAKFLEEVGFDRAEYD